MRHAGEGVFEEVLGACVGAAREDVSADRSGVGDALGGDGVLAKLLLETIGGGGPNNGSLVVLVMVN